MNIRDFARKLSAALVVCAISLMAPAAHSEGKGTAKAKGKEQVEAKDKNGREAGELPFGLQQHSTKKGELPSGLQKKKDATSQLTRGLEQGGKSVKPNGKIKKDQNRRH